MQRGISKTFLSVCLSVPGVGVSLKMDFGRNPRTLEDSDSNNTPRDVVSLRILLLFA